MTFHMFREEETVLTNNSISFPLGHVETSFFSSVFFLITDFILLY